MTRQNLVLALLLAAFVACSGPGRKENTSPDLPELKGRGDLKATELRLVDKDPAKVPAVAIRIEAHGTDVPVALKNNLNQGRDWLYLARPVGFSFAVIGLSKGHRSFVSETRSVTFAQEAESNIVVNQGEAPPLEPALVRLGGEIPLERASAPLEVIEDPGLTVLGLGSVINKHMRVLLGRGMDNALSMANKQQGGVRQMDTHEFVAVIDKQGNSVAEWEAHLEEAIRAGNFDPLGEDSMVVRRWRVSAAQRATYFKISFVHLLLCAHMKLEPVAGGFAWTWEGIWGCRLRGAPPEGMSHVLDKAPPVVLNYKEYDRSSKESARKFWRNFFTPIALGVDFGGDMLAHLVDPEADGSMFAGK